MLADFFKSSPGIVALISLNLIVFVAMIASGVSWDDPSTSDLMRFGGMARPEVQAGQYWRLFSSLFVHAGIMHLASNVFMLFLIRNHLAKILSPITVVACYLFGGLCASLASVSFYVNTVSVGASGAVLALCGMLIIFAARKMYEEEENSEVLKMALIVSVFSIVMGLGADSDNAAHIAGVASGLILGLLYTTFAGTEYK